jgi:hypothetical protein
LPTINIIEKQQDDRREVDGCQCFARTNDSESHHQNGADDRGARSVDLHPGEFPQGKDDVAGDEDDVGRKNPCVREQCGAERRHLP